MWPQLIPIHGQKQRPFTPPASLLPSPWALEYDWSLLGENTPQSPTSPPYAPLCSVDRAGVVYTCYYCLWIQGAENYEKSFWTLPVLHNLLLIVKFHVFGNSILATNFLWLFRCALSLCFSFSHMLTFLGTGQQTDWCSFRRARILFGCW